MPVEVMILSSAASVIGSCCLSWKMNATRYDPVLSGHNPVIVALSSNWSQWLHLHSEPYLAVVESIAARLSARQAG